MVTGSSFALANPHVLNLTTFFIWGWSLIPTHWSNELLRTYILLKELPDRCMRQVARTWKAITHSFTNDEYWFYKVGDHYFAQHTNSSVMRVHKGKPQWLYTPHNTLFSWVEPIVNAASVETRNRLVEEPVVFKRLPIIGATLYHKSAVEIFEYDMSDWISEIRIMSPQSQSIAVLPLLVLVLAWGLTHDICFEGDLSSMEIVMMLDNGDEERFNVVTQEVVEEGEITAMNDDLVVSEEDVDESVEAAANAEEEPSSESDSSPAPVHRPLQTTPVEGIVE